MQQQVFISYARKDGRGLALRLQADFQAKGYDVWLDTSEIEGGASWSRDIEKAIDECDLVLALLSFGSFISEICRAEQLRALRKGKRIIPLLVQPTAERPIYLESLNYRDFTEMSQYEDSLAILLTDISGDAVTGTVSVHKTLVTAPPLPRNFVPRPEALEKLRQAVISDTTDRQIALTALEGMGGIGKTTLANALCHDEVIQDAFPDGVLWVEIGREPSNLTTKMQSVGQALNDPIGYYTTEESATARLREILPSKAILIVLDDVWDALYVRPFLADAPRCRILMTTRKGIIADILDATQVQLSVLKPDQAVTMLQETVGHNDHAFSKIAKRVGYLPLALKMVGSRLKDGTSGTNWLKSFTKLSQLKLSRNPHNSHESMELCFDLSVQQLSENDRKLFYTLSIFPEDTFIPNNVVTLLWRNIEHELLDSDCEDLLLDLNRLALIERNIAGGYITMHDLLHDYTVEKLGSDNVLIHNELLGAFNPDSRPWHEISYDAYLYSHLAYHLISSGRRQELHQLLTSSPEWMRKKFIHCAGDSSYMADLQLVVGEYCDPLSDDSLLELVKLHTARQVINARIKGYSDEMLTALVWLDREAEALSHAKLRFEKSDQFKGLIAIHKCKQELKRTEGELLIDVLSVAKSIEDIDDRMKALSDVASELIKDKKYATAESVIREFERIDIRMESLSDLAHSLIADSDYIAAETLARSLENESLQVQVLMDLGVALTNVGDIEKGKRLYIEAAEVVWNIEHTSQRAQALGKLSVLLIAMDELELARRNFLQARSIALTLRKSDAAECVRALDKIAVAYVTSLSEKEAYTAAESVGRDIIAEEVRTETLSNLATASIYSGHIEMGKRLYVEAEYIARSIIHKTNRNKALISVVVGLTKGHFYEDAERVADTIKDVASRAAELCGVADALIAAGDMKNGERLYQKIKEIVQDIKNDSMQIDVLNFLALGLAKMGLYLEAENVTKGIKDISKRANLLSRLVVILLKAGDVESGKRIYRYTEDIVKDIEDTVWRTRVLISLARTLTEAGHVETAKRLCQKAEGVMPSVTDISQQTQILNCVVTELIGKKSYSEAEDIAKDIEDISVRVNALINLARAVTEAGQMETAKRICHELEQVAKDIVAESTRLQALVDLATVLIGIGDIETGKRLYAEVEDIARNMKYPSSCAEMLSLLASKMMGLGDVETGKRLCSEAENIARNSNSTKQLMSISFVLTQEGLYEEAERIARSIDNVNYYRDALKKIVITLTKEGLYGEAKRLAWSIDDSYCRTEALKEIVVMLGNRRLHEEAEQVARSIDDSEGRVVAMGGLATSLMESGQVEKGQQLYEEAEQVARSIDDSENRIVAVYELANSLLEGKMYLEAERVGRSIEATFKRWMILSNLTDELLKSGMYAAAMNVSSYINIEQFMTELLGWEVGSDLKVSKLDLFFHALQIICWERPSWNSVFEILKGASTSISLRTMVE